MKPARLRLILICLAQLLAIAMPREADAWGAEGNRIIALIADRLLQAHDPAVYKKVLAILATDKTTAGPGPTLPARQIGRMR